MALKTFTLQDGESLDDALRRHRRLLTVAELANALSMSPKTLYSQAKRGRIPAKTIFGSVRFDAVEIADWMKALCKKRK